MPSDASPPFRAVIFDMDGVLTDSEPAFHAAVNDVLAPYGKRIGIDEYRPFIGMATAEMWTRVLALKDVPASLDEILEAYEPPLMRRLREPRRPLPGARELIGALRAHRVPLGLCTASYERWAGAILAASGLDGLFDALSTADEVTRTKPDPEPYVLAAYRLGLTPQQCVVVEDSASGVMSAARAGAHVLQLRATSTSAPPQPGAARVLESLAGFPLHLVVRVDHQL